MSPITSTEREFSVLEAANAPARHFKLMLIAAALRVRQVLEGEHALSEFPFLEAYAEEAGGMCGAGASSESLLPRFREQVARWTAQTSASLPLRLLAEETSLSVDAIDLLLAIGLIEEDVRFGPLFEWAQPACPGQHRPTHGLLTAWWRHDSDCAAVRSALSQLCQLGLIGVTNNEAPRLCWAYEATPILWDVLRGETDFAGTPWVKFQERGELPQLADLTLPHDGEQKAAAIPGLLSTGRADAVIVRGPLHNGRKTLLRAIARTCGLGVLEVEAGLKLEGVKAAILGTLCILLRALPVFTFELAPGETACIPALGRYAGPQGFAVNRHGNIEGKVVERSVLFELPLPDRDARRKLWISALLLSEPEVTRWAENLRLTSGNIFRGAELASRQALLECAPQLDEGHVRRGARALQQPLENLAKRLEGEAAWTQVVAAPDILCELHNLANRCRFREQLALAPALANSNCGVKALFAGPSGTGKTLAARVLASELQLDLYRLDLSSIVNKYLGETEKNLSQVLSRAEELNVVLLLDEGDSLLTNRTAVQSSNDRYANLETNFLLQRLESFEGILLITTNALHRIDGAFQRRMDVLIEFRMPEPEERRQLWQLHLPPDHEVAETWIDEVARRCTFTGGQIRNAASHAALLALARQSPVNTGDATTAVFREYQKLGAVCPLRRTGGR